METIYEKTTLSTPLVRSWFLPRVRTTHKGHYGRVLIVAGSDGMFGAAVLCARAALRSGAGLVTVACEEANYGTLHTAVPEAMCCSPDPDELKSRPCDVLAIGPGLPVDERTLHLLEAGLEGRADAVVVDAGALSAAAAFGLSFSGVEKEIVLTPHEGEASRLLGASVQEVRAQRRKAVTDMVGLTGAVCVLKGADTLIGGPCGTMYINPTGNPGMATAGSGDVLTGILSGLLARRSNGFPDVLSATAFGVYVHGAAGDAAVQTHGETSLVAGDIIEALPGVFLSVGG